MLFRFGKKGRDKDQIVYIEKIEHSKLELTSANVKKLIQHSTDIIFRELYINGDKNLSVTMVFVDGLIDVKSVDDNILKPLTQEMKLSQSKNIGEIINQIEHGTLYHVMQKTREKLGDCVNDVIDGSVALIFDQAKKAITFDIKGYEKRTVSEPSDENVIKGAKDSFVESIRTNTATIRRKIKTYNLIIEETTIGKQTLTKVAITYIKGITNRNIIQEVKKRLSKIDTDGVLTSGVIEESIVDRPKSPFPQIIYTERPDKFCANVVEGRVGLLIDGLPVTFVIPGTIASFLQAPEDYTYNYLVGSVIRTLRYVLMFTTLILPGFYVALTTFHHEMIPTNLALAIAASKEGVPFPSFIEVIFMLIAFEILMEAGLRLPKTIGQAVSIVGAVVVGQAAVEANFVSPSVIVIIALTAISTFTMPNQDFSNALRIWRFILVIMSSIIGLFGLTIGLLLLLVHLSDIEVYGIPYLSPFVGGENKQMQDSIFRFPYYFQRKRPIELKTYNKKKEDSGGN